MRMNKTALLIALCAAPLLAHASPTDPKQAYIDSTFTAMDSNKDGRVDKTEFTAYQQARFSKQADSIDAAFAAMDKNKDGKISK
jgi:Ca2+-binding EF-hand superfamily protein